MAIIYSYPVEATPTTSDTILGTSMGDQKETKSFTIASLAALVTTNSGTGTVTNVATANSTFINMTGGPISTSGTLQASLSATGTPSDTTFLRGDNTWAPASTTGSPNIEVLNEGSSITSAVTSLNFTGGGVTASVGSSNDVTINIPSVTSAVSSIIAGTGIDVDQATGDVTVTNTGVTSLVAGTNVTLNPTSGIGNVTINATNNPGTVQSIIAGNGLELTSGVITANPNIGVEYNGSNNYILVGSSAATATGDDFIAFNQLTSSDIKTTRLLDLPETALPLVTSYIDTGDANTVKNNTDTYTTTATVNNVVTLTQTEYSGLGSKDPNTLYVVVADVSAGTAYTVTLTPVTNNIVSPDGTGTGTGYTITGSVLNDTVTGIAGEPYSFTTTLTPTAGYYFSVPVSGNVVSGTIASTTGVGQTLTGTVTTVPTPTITATLLVVYDVQGGPQPTVTAGKDDTGATQSTSIASSLSYVFDTTVDTPANYSWTSGPTYSNATGTINGSQTVVTTVTGVLQLT